MKNTFVSSTVLSFYIITSWVNEVLLLCVQQLCICSHVLGYALMLLVEIGGCLSRRGGGQREGGSGSKTLLELKLCYS